MNTLRKEFRKMEVYEDCLEKADAIIFNNYHNIFRALQLRAIYPHKLFIHRLGPIFNLHRGQKWKLLDKTILDISNTIADLAVFQSEWAYDQALELGFNPLKKKVIIGNSTDDEVFNAIRKAEPENHKTKLVTDCWSKNWKKGFEFYKFLDENLDFSQYSMTFIGNSPIAFKNIKMMSPLPGKELAVELKKGDIFVSAVSDDAYSNSIVEALACGLPVIGLDSGGNREVIKNGGVLFKSKADLMEKISQVKDNYSHYKSSICLDSTFEVAKKYIQSIKNIDASLANNLSLNLKIIALHIKMTLALLITKI